jgi:hypothetical protein
MMQKITLSLLMVCCLLTSTLIAQDTNNKPVNEGSSLLEKSQWSLNVLPLNLAYEHRIGDKSTIYAQAGIDLSRYQAVEDSNVAVLPRRTYALAPKVNVQYRYYYNLEKRKATMKNIASNSGNFIGAEITPLLPPIWIIEDKEIIKENGVVLGAMWGLQRVKKDLIVFNLKMGPALRITTEGVSTELLQGTVSIGFILGD